MERLEPEVRRELARFGPAAGMGPLVEAWPAAVGPGIATNAWPARLQRDGTLVVHTRDSVWAFELAQRAGEIREQLGEDAPSRLRFVAGPIPEPAAEAAAEAAALAAAAVVRPSAGELALAEELAAPIEDEKLRKVVAKAAAFGFARAAADHSV